MISGLLAKPPAPRHHPPPAPPPPKQTFRGDLSVIDLPTLLQMLAQRNMRGTLTLLHHGFTRMLTVDRETVSLAPPGRHGPASRGLHRARLGQILMLHGMVRRHDLDAAMRQQQLQPVRGLLGDILLSRHAVTPDDLTRALALQASEELQELMHWHDGSFDFRPGPAPFVRQQPPLPIYPLVMEAARRTDEWSRIRAAIPSKDQIALRADGYEPPPDAAGPVADSVLSLADGRHTVGEIIAQAGFPEFDSSGAMARLIEQGRVVLDRPHPAVDESTLTLVISPRHGYAEMLAAQLRDRGIAADSLPTEAGALERALETAPPRVIILDSRDLDADIVRLREHPRACDAKLMVLVAEPSRRAVLSLLRHGASDVVVTPASIDRLALRVRRLLLKTSAA